VNDIPPNIPPPEVLMLSVVRCHVCGHGIDPHGVDPGGYCAVGDEDGVLCECLWSPNDIAAWWRADLRAKVGALIEYGCPEWSVEVDDDLGRHVRKDQVLDLIDGAGS